MRIFFYTLGCKLNQLETEALAGAFEDAGFTFREEEPPGISGIHGAVLSFPGLSGKDLALINTCTVTSRAEQKARRLIRLCLRRGWDVIVTGCYAELDAETLGALVPAPLPAGDPLAGARELSSTAEAAASAEASLLVIPGRAKDSLFGLPRFLAEGGTPSAWNAAGTIPPSGGINEGFRFKPRRVFHSRSFLKIQDGCDRNCAYCRVPLARGKSVSLGPAEVLRRLKAEEEAGMAEAVITGVNICRYRDSVPGGDGDGGVETAGAPTEIPAGLPELLRFLLENTSRIALRLSSIEPERALFTDVFFDILGHRRIRNHFHLSLQSGSGRILKAMGRPYDAGDILETVERIRVLRDDPFLACDIITGFPGETERDFEETLALCRRIGFAWIHAFPYSPRPGTSAAVMKNQVDPHTAEKRAALLGALAREGRQAYVRRWLGKTVEAVQSGIKKGGFCAALTDNYIRILAAPGGSLPLPGTAFRCTLEETLPLNEDSGAYDALAVMAH